MAGVTLGFLKYVLGLDTLAFRRGMTEAERDLVKLQKTFQKKGEQFQALGKGLTAFVTLPIAGIAAQGIKEAQETEQAMAQVTSAITSTGGAAKVTAAEIKKAADSLELRSLYEGDQILKDVSARLLAFGNVTGATFGRAQQVIVDFATRTNRDLGSATTLIGKALNDPAKAMGVLSKAGVQLTADQQALIKSLQETGNTAGAQAVLLGALETKFRGAAQAAQNTDPINKFNDAWKQMAETIGTALLPILPVVADAVASVANAFNSLSPSTQKFILIAGGLAAALGPVLIGLGSLLKLLALTKTLTLFAAGMTGIGAASGTAATGATAAGIAVRGLLGPLGLALTAVTGVYLAWKNWDKIQPIVQNMVTGVANRIRGNLYPQLEDLKSKLNSVGNAFKTLYDRVVGHSYIPDMVNEVGEHIARLNGLLVEPVKAMTAKAAAAFRAAAAAAQPLRDLLARLYPEAVANNQYLADLKTLEDNLKSGKLSAEEYADALKRLNEERARSQPAEAPATPANGTGSDGDTPRPEGSDYFENFDAFMAKAKTATNELAEATKQLGAIGERALNSLNDGIVDAILNSKSLGDVFHNVAKQMLADLLKLALQMAEKQLFAAFAGGFSGGGQVGAPAGFASGGFVSGKGTSTSDSIPAMLSNGEFVINAAATKKFLPLLKQINAGAIKLAGGGLAMPRRSFSNDNLRRIRGGGGTVVPINIAIDATGADAAGLARVRDELQQLKAELPGHVVNAYHDARSRFVIRG